MALEKSKSAALVRQSSESALMPPPPKRIKRPKNVIDENSYTDAISEIIARDFFPGLLESETQQEYLDALESKDGAWISNVSRRLHQVMTPGRKRGGRGTSIQMPARASDTPREYVGDTPMSVMSSMTAATDAAKPTEVDTNMSLDNFQAKYTSEDNESFYKLIDKQNQKRAEKYAWMWQGNKMPSKMMLKQKEVEIKLLQSRQSLKDNGWDKDRLAIQDKVEKPARPDAWKSKPQNQLMFRPEGIEDSLETVAQKAQTESRAEPKGVAYANTRLPAPEIQQSSDVPPSPSLSAIKDALAGHRRVADSESDFHGGETPRVNGYAFVDEDEPEPESQTHIADPIIDLGKGETTKNPFIIRGQSKREDLHHRMVDKVASSKRTSTKVGMTGKVDMIPVPKFPSSPRVNTGQLTPAAQRLWSRVGRPGTVESPSAFGSKTPGTVRAKSNLKTKWTPVGK